jgi:hypothetical protein
LRTNFKQFVRLFILCNSNNDSLMALKPSLLKAGLCSVRSLTWGICRVVDLFVYLKPHFGKIPEFKAPLMSAVNLSKPNL